MRSWIPSWDLTTIPDKQFSSEWGRRRNLKRKTKSGGVVWSEHVEGYSRCRCIACTSVREERRAQPQQPKRPRGRPPKVMVLETDGRTGSFPDGIPVQPLVIKKRKPRETKSRSRS